MNRLLGRCRIGCQVAILGIVGLLGMLVVAGIGQIAANQIGRHNTEAIAALDAKDMESDLQNLLLQARRQEKNFLLRHDEKSLTLFAKAITSIGKKFSELEAALAGEPPTLAAIARIKADTGRYVAAFQAMVAQARAVGLTETQGLLGELRASVHSVEDALKRVDAPQAQIGMLMMRRHEKDFLARLDPKYGAELKSALPAFVIAIDAIPLQPDARTSLMANMTAYQDAFQRLMASKLAERSAEKNMIAVYNEIEPRLLEFDGIFVTRTQEAGARAEAITNLGHRVVLASIGGILLIITGLCWVVGRGIARPIVALTRSMEALAKGDLNAPVPADVRRDELGTMVRAAQSFKDSLIQAERMREARAAAQIQAEADKRTALVDMAERIESQAGAAVLGIGERTKTMTGTAEQMRSMAVRTSQSAQGAASAAELALANAQTVASAAEELAASISEISAQVSHATMVVSDTVVASEATQTAIETLSERVDRIGIVADIISGIAARTNLLALNATIEAARAGDAGKGFAVVASEVKQLATQTANSTREINEHIGAVRAATAAAVTAVSRIGSTIGAVTEIAGSIAAAVEQQGSATAEIARNVSETASAVTAMNARNDDVSQEAERGGSYADEVLENTKGLESAVHDLRQTLIRTIRTSTAEADRRTSRRYAIDIQCRVDLPGLAGQTARVVDVSEGGARVVGLSGMTPGTRGTLRMDGLTVALAIESLKSADEASHLRFHANESEQRVLQAFLEKLTLKSAA